MKRIPYSRQSIGQDDIRATVKALRSDWLTQGPAVEEFEHQLCRQTGARYAVAMSSGTAALHLACLAAGIGRGDEVVTPAITFAASANCILYCSAKPRFADIEPASANISPEEIEKLITPKTKAVICVHYAGNPCDLEKIRRICRRRRLLVIEDAAHALGATYKGLPVGNGRYSDMAIFSFHPVKPITTGEGGAVTTGRKDLYERLLLLRSHGITKSKERLHGYDGPWYYEMQELGFNYRITDIQCALGTSQLKKLGSFLEKRRAIVRRYARAFKENPYFDIPAEQPAGRSAWHLYPIRLKDAYISRRREFFEALQAKGIGVQVHYIPVYLHPYYRALGYKAGLCPQAEAFYKRQISIPLHQSMTSGDIQRVIAALQRLA
jgi:perosamine synthetase